MKRFTKLFGVIICLTMVFCMSRQVKADIIWTPEDDFFEKHYEECKQLLRNYTANGEEGYIEIKEDPTSKKTVENVKNGTEFYVSFTYTDRMSRVWGVVEHEKITGWILMKDLLVIYDNISFLEEHKDEIKTEPVEFDDTKLDGRPVHFYQYPGSVGTAGVPLKKEEKPQISSTYEDSEGRLWGYVSYYFASKGWICLSDPTNAELQGSPRQPGGIVIPPATSIPKPANAPIRTEVILITVLVTVLVLGTVVAIRIFWKKNK